MSSLQQALWNSASCCTNESVVKIKAAVDVEADAEVRSAENARDCSRRFVESCNRLSGEQGCHHGGRRWAFAHNLVEVKTSQACSRQQQTLCAILPLGHNLARMQSLLDQVQNHSFYSCLPYQSITIAIDKVDV